MSLSQLLFVFLFLPVSLLLYRIAPQKTKNAVLLLLSLIFIAWGDLANLPLILCSVGFNYFTALELVLLSQAGSRVRKNLVLFSGIAANIALLFFFKYAAPLLGGLQGLGISSNASPALSVSAAPIGISFFSFSAVSCLVDVATGRARPAKNPLDFALYITFFPKMLSGPIVPYGQMEPQFTAHAMTAASLEKGMRRFLVGLAKKVMLADQLGLFYTEIAALPADSLSTVSAWSGALFYSFMLYFDFSGYSDMAIGLGKMFGFTFPENFDYPYLSRSITDFWRRWHMSLGMWFRYYVYIPLGGSRKGNMCTIRNLLVVWLLTGIWHGANLTFLVWGIYWGLLLILEKFVFANVLEKIPSVIRGTAVFVLAVIGWTVFSSSDLSQALTRVSHMCGIGFPWALDNTARYHLSSGGLLLLIAMGGATPLPAMLANRLMKHDNMMIHVASVIYFALLLASCTVCMVSGTYSSFLYAQF